MFDNTDAVRTEYPVSGVVLDGSRWRVVRLAVDFEDAPSTVVAD